MNDVIRRLEKLMDEISFVSIEVKKVDEPKEIPAWYRLNDAWRAIDDARTILKKKEKVK